jgi:Fe2+ transport system protein B
VYGRTPRGKTPKWITIFLISFFACLAALFFMVGIVISIDIQSIFPALITVFFISVFTAILSALGYNMNHAYIEIEDGMIKIVEYPFFKKRERRIFLQDIKKVKWHAGGGRGQLPFLAFKNNKNKMLFHLDYVPEVISYFEGLGFKIEY